jgi:hypothetical protein
MCERVGKSAYMLEKGSVGKVGRYQMPLWSHADVFVRSRAIHPLIAEEAAWIPGNEPALVQPAGLLVARNIIRILFYGLFH